MDLSSSFMLLQRLSGTFEDVDQQPLPARRRDRALRAVLALGPVAIPLCSRELVHGTAPRARWAAVLLRQLARAGHDDKVRGALYAAAERSDVDERGRNRASRLAAHTLEGPAKPMPLASLVTAEDGPDPRALAAARAHMGLRELAHGRRDGASEHLHQAVALEPDNPDHLWNLAAAQNRGGCDGTRYLALTAFLICVAPSARRAAIARDTVADYERSVRLRYGDADPAVVAAADQQCTRGQRLARRGEHAQAIAWFQGAVSAVPDHAVAWTELGLAHRELGHVNAAVQTLRRAVQTSSADSRARKALTELAPVGTTVG